MTEVVLATRNPGKVREIRAILEAVPGLSPVGLDALGIPETAEEDGLETAPTFAENALAKARYFAARTGRIVLADDSGLAVDALDGAPGVHSRRFAGADRLRGRGLVLVGDNPVDAVWQDRPAAPLGAWTLLDPARALASRPCCS